MKPVRSLLVLAPAVLVLAASSTATSAPDAARRNAARFLKRVVAQLVRNDYAAAWTTLHPEHQRVAPIDESSRASR